VEHARLRRWRWRMIVPAAAVLVMAVWLAMPRRPAADRPGAVRVEPAPDASTSSAALEQLARIEPPVYVKLQTRGAPDPTEAAFERGMDAYARGDYRNAVGLLEKARTGDGARVDFFLGISLAMIGDTDRAIEVLARAATPNSPYADEARMILAKVYVRKGDIGAAARELATVAEQRGPRAAEARALLDQVRALR
jgi:TolA-binding protein